MDNSLKWVLSNIESGQTTSNAGLNQEEGCLWLIRPIEICPYRLSRVCPLTQKTTPLLVYLEIFRLVSLPQNVIQLQCKYVRPLSKRWKALF